MQELINEVLESDDSDPAANNKPACKPDSKLTPEQLKKVKVSRLFNVCTLVFTLVLTAVALVTFFVALGGRFSGDYAIGNAYAIASTYILVMLLAVPTLKVFLDKCTCRNLKIFNITTIILSFVAILVLAVVISLTFAFPQMFA